MTTIVPCEDDTSASIASDSKPPLVVGDDSDGEQTAASTNSSVPSEKDATAPPKQSTSASAFLSFPETEPKRFHTLQERAKIPPGIYLSTLLVVSFLYSSGFISNFSSNVVPGIWDSLSYVATDVQQKIGSYFDYFLNSKQTCFSPSNISWPWFQNIMVSALVVTVIGSIYYLLMVKPFRAGMWTGARASRHRLHRYMGLLFLIQYSLAWYEFIVNYEGSAKASYLPVTIALNGIIQATSAYFSFKVLPNLADAGFYSDKAVLSRFFVFENLFYQLLTLFGSIYYNDVLRSQLQSSKLGRGLEILFVFFPYAFVRPWFPTTHFKDAGTSMSGRSKANERFYIVATSMVKFFYLWAKYFIGFFINWHVFLGKPSAHEMKFIRGLFLLNGGTVSIAVFLHTLRFKKVLAPRLMFSLYLAQIYATFSAIPIAYVMFTTNPSLAALTFVGLLCNLTRSRLIHAVWCCSSYFLLCFSSVQW